MPPHRLGQDRAYRGPAILSPKGQEFLWHKAALMPPCQARKMRLRASYGNYFAAAEARSTATPGPIVEDSEIFLR